MEVLINYKDSYKIKDKLDLHTVRTRLGRQGQDQTVHGQVQVGASGRPAQF